MSGHIMTEHTYYMSKEGHRVWLPEGIIGLYGAQCHSSSCPCAPGTVGEQTAELLVRDVWRGAPREGSSSNTNVSDVAWQQASVRRQVLKDLALTTGGLTGLFDIRTVWRNSGRCNKTIWEP